MEGSFYRQSLVRQYGAGPLSASRLHDKRPGRKSCVGQQAAATLSTRAQLGLVNDRPLHAILSAHRHP